MRPRQVRAVTTIDVVLVPDVDPEAFQVRVHQTMRALLDANGLQGARLTVHIVPIDPPVLPPRGRGRRSTPLVRKG